MRKNKTCGFFVGRRTGGTRNLTEFEGGFDGVRVELTKVGLEDVRILDEYRSPGGDQRVQSVEQDEPYRHHHPGGRGECDKGGGLLIRNC